MTQAGQVVFSKMEEVVWGKPAAETVAALAQKRGAERVFLMVSGTLNRTTDEIDKLRRALGNKCVGTFDRMPAHTPRSAVIAASEASATGVPTCTESLEPSGSGRSVSPSGSTSSSATSDSGS